MAGKPKVKPNEFAQRRLRPADVERYGVPEWVDVERGIDHLNDLDYDGLKAIEEQLFAELGTTLTLFVGAMIETYSIDAMRVRLWFGLLAAGHDIKLADFKPAAFNLERRARPGADADPPAANSESSPASTETTTPESETSTSASTPGSGPVSTG